MEIKTSEEIRKTLKLADQNGTLGALAHKVGILGGAASLRRIMETPGSIGDVDRAMISMRLG